MLKRLIKAYRGNRPGQTVPNWPKDRGFDLYLPEHAPKPIPLIVLFHGYTQDGTQMRLLTGPTGSPDDPDLFDLRANQRGYAVAYPYGTKIGIMPGRCWNGGGRLNGYAPVGDPAVRLDVPDLDFFQDMLELLSKQYSVDCERVFLAGISNGGAMVHRLAVELPDRVRAMATVAGCNQFSAASGNQPQKPVPLLHIHGTEDKVWPYRGGKFGTVGNMVSVDESVQGWVRANQANLVEEKTLPPVDPTDPVRVILDRYQGLSPVEFYRLEGGGHSWPGGAQFMSEKVIGKVSRQLSANQCIFDFFETHR